MTTINAQFCSDEEDRELREENPETPELFAFDCGQLPFERMGDAHFELLLADLYAARAADGSEDWYDKARRLNDGADQGRDVIPQKYQIGFYKTLRAIIPILDAAVDKLTLLTGRFEIHADNNSTKTAIDDFCQNVPPNDFKTTSETTSETTLPTAAPHTISLDTSDEFQVLF